MPAFGHTFVRVTPLPHIAHKNQLAIVLAPQALNVETDVSILPHRIGQVRVTAGMEHRGLELRFDVETIGQHLGFDHMEVRAGDFKKGKAHIDNLFDDVFWHVSRAFG